MKCKQCKQKISKYARECPYCKTEITIDSRIVDDYLEKVNNIKTQVEKPKRQWNIKISKKVKVSLGAVAALGLVVFCTYNHYKNEWKPAENMIYYSKNDSLYARDLAKNEEKEIAKLDNKYDSKQGFAKIEQETIYYDKSRQRIYYADDIVQTDYLNSYNIYQKSTLDTSKTPKCIAENIKMHVWGDDGTLYYVIQGENDLKIYNGSKTTSLEISYADELIYVKDTGKLISKVGNTYTTDNNYLNDVDMDLGDSYQMIDPKTGVVQDIIGDPVRDSILTSDCKHIYYLQDNQLMDYDIDKQEASLFKRNVYQYSLKKENGVERLYYISFTLDKLNLYDCYKDSYEKQDEKITKSKELQKKETDAQKLLRNGREQFREELKSQTIGIFRGKLFCYANGETKEIDGDISTMFSDEYEFENHTLAIEKTEKVTFKKFEILEDVNNNKQIRLETIDSYYDDTYEDEEGNYEEKEPLGVNLREVYYYEEGVSNLMQCVIGDSMNSMQVYEGKIFKDSFPESFSMWYGSARILEGKTYYVDIEKERTLFTYTDPKSTEKIEENVWAFEPREDGSIIALLGGARRSGGDMILIDRDGKRSNIDSKIDVIFGKYAWNGDEENDTFY